VPARASAMIYALSLHDALPIFQTHYREPMDWTRQRLLEASDELYRWYELLRNDGFDASIDSGEGAPILEALNDDLNTWEAITRLDRKSTRLNSSHVKISYAVVC